ncbi:adenylate/guanylate cyclase domain-containing protein [Actinoplanes sp. N902-109]|uniref:AAA family ATPase n=1 Tax=Actinoplanes sp. (strain N902-109) TaxID=649831 RepID=UPI0003295B9B|nr:adenylate/guanylate cyclase domain-containing protein [Actinoplanes sp. N902-109]AGL17738.1 adenylate/guanylate cyclase [Actinoplanes sp. N902-109]
MSRRLVVVLFLDLVGWTGLAERVDPEPLQDLLERYYGLCATAVEEHGGVIEKFIGDAVMAVFGAAHASEDDALRALRTAQDIRSGAGALRVPGAHPVRVHCGIAAGEALVTQSPRAGLRVIGDVVNLAARLQSAAAAGEIVVNDVVARLAAPRAAMTPVAPLTLKGKSAPVPAWRVDGPAGDHPPVDDGSPMVDRDAERSRLRALAARVAAEGRIRSVTVLGPPGIGKSRLVREVLGELGDAGRAVVGTCPSYGPDGDRTTLLQVLTALAAVTPPGERVAAVLTALRRRTGAGPGPGVEEVAWAARELVQAAADHPLVLVWDSLEWAGPSLLRLIAGLRDGVPDRPVLLICVARPDLMDSTVPWLRDGDEVIELGPLDPADSMLLAGLVTAGDAEVQAHDAGDTGRIVEHSAGNPLFIRLLAEAAVPGELPPTVTALVGAMIDRLPPAARELLGAAAVAGSSFTGRQLACLGADAAPADLHQLARRQLIRRDGSGDAYSFVQQPVHEVAYGRLDKRQRLHWHRRLAGQGISRGFHLEAAAGLLSALHPDDPGLPALGTDAARALLDEGTTALRERDVSAATGLLTRALRVLPAGAPDCRAVVAIRLSDALLLTGDTARAVQIVTDAADGLAHTPAGRALLAQRLLLDVRRGRATGAELDVLEQAVARDPADRLTACRFEQLRMLVRLNLGRFGAAEQAARAALGHARALRDEYEQDRLLVALCELRQWSPVRLSAQLAGCAELAARFATDRFLLVPVLAARARCLALLGRDAAARAALAEAQGAVDELRLTMGQVLLDQAAGLTDALAGDHRGAHGHFSRAAGAADRAGHVPTALTLRVQAARELAHDDPAGAVRELGALLDRHREMETRGRVLALAALVRLAAGDRVDEVVTLLAMTDDPCLRGDVLFDLAVARRRLGAEEAARTTAAAAVTAFASVGAEAPARAVRAWL